jgi:hypothetical protein
MANNRTGIAPLDRIPVVDDRDRERLIAQIKRIAPFYTPEWKFNPDDPDPGTALALMFIHLLEGNIRRLNQVPYKSFLAFLNRFHVDLAPAQPAVAQLTFHLVEGAPEPVLVEKGTQVAAQVAGDPEPIVFETVGPILLTTANLVELWSVSPRRDRIVKLAALAEGERHLELNRDGRGTALFGQEGENVQSHAMYVRHDFLFLLHHPAVLELTFANGINENAAMESVRLMADPNKVSWEYYHDGEWHPFDRVYGRQTVIRLLKLRHRRLDPCEYDGRQGYWIRCRAKTLDVKSGGAELAKVQFDRLTIKSDFAAATDDAGIRPDKLFFNDLQFDAEEGGLAFGDYFAQYGLFYIANEEAFSKRGARITLRFNLSFRQHRFIPDRPPQINWKLIMKRHEVDKTEIPDPITIALVQWEYWNGNTWAMLSVDAAARTLFSTPWEGAEEREVSFVCPEDMAKIFVNAEENYWIRARIVKIDNAYSPNGIYFSPFIERLRIRYGYERPLYPPQALLVENNLERRDHTNEAQSGGFTFRPFVPLDGTAPAVWFGFDAPPERGPIHLYVDVKPRPVAADSTSFIQWEYLRRIGGTAVWAPLAVADDTNEFTRSGYIQFVGPRDFAQATYFGSTRYWIRAVNRDGRYDAEVEAAHVPRALAVLPNTVLAVQQRTIRNELPLRQEVYDTAEEHMTEYYKLAEAPVLSEEVWVDETESLSEEDIRRLEREGTEVDIVRDSEQQVMRVWVRYREVKHFLHSGPDDRHYAIDRATGRLTFGNGTAGKKPPRDREDAVRVTYTTGGGKRGNVPAGAVSSLQSSIAYVDRVVNYAPAAGGCDAGNTEEAVVRGPKRFKHHHRAVTAEDYEWLTREAHPNVAKVKCLPNVNARLEPQPGAVTVVVLPKSGVGGGAHFRELKRTVEAKLLEHAASNIAFPGNIQVIEPALLEIGVQATVWVRSMDDVVPVEREIIRKLNEFLDPVTGNADGRGWDIGQIVHPSMFYSLLKSVGPVVHIPRLSLDVYKVEHGDRTEWHPDRIGDLPHSVVVPGMHRVTVELKK